MLQFAWAQYRGVIDIGGRASDWGLFWRLATGSVVFRVPGSFVSSYSRHLRPWVHFIPIADDLSDLLNASEKVQWESAYYRMPVTARQLLRNFTYNREVDRVARELSRVLSTTPS